MIRQNKRGLVKRARCLSENESVPQPLSARRRVNDGEVALTLASALPLVMRLKIPGFYDLAASVISGNSDHCNLGVYYNKLCNTIKFLFAKKKRYRFRCRRKSLNSKFDSDPKRVVQEILKGQIRATMPEKSATKSYYKELWCDPGRENFTKSNCDNFDPITAGEIFKALRKTKRKACGGISEVTPLSLKKFANEHIFDLVVFFNALVKFKQIPIAMKRGKVSLLPKTQDAGSNLNKYRPVTIHCAVYRLFSKILDSRIRNAIGQRFSQYQAGMTAGEGVNACAKSVVRLRAAIAHAWKNRRSIAVAGLDVRKAFDRVQQGAILKGLQSMACPDELIDLCKESFSNVTRVIKTRKGPIFLRITRGVAQGLALSGTLFCVAINGLCEVMENSGYKYTETLRSPTIWSEPGGLYFDDVLLVDSDIDSLRRRINRVGELLSEAGLELNTDKSVYIASYRARNKNKDYCTVVEPLETTYGVIENKHVDGFRYLGANIKLKRERPRFNERLRNELAAIVNSHLSIKSKIKAIRGHIIPRQLFGLSLHSPDSYWGYSVKKNKKRLYGDLDRSVKQALKRVLKIGKFEHSMKLAYVPVKDGGLGFPKFQQILPGIRSRLFETFEGTERELLRRWHFNDFDSFQQFEENLGHTNRAERRSSVTQINLDEFRGLENGAGNWHVGGLNKIPVVTENLNGGAFVNAFRLRAGLLPFRGKDAKCRLCKESRDTLVHLLTAKCSQVSKDFLIERHNQVVTVVRNFIKKKVVNESSEPRFRMIRELLFEESDGNKAKPDLVFIDTTLKQIFIIEIQVSYESKRTGLGRREVLSLRAEEKLKKYHACVGLFKSGIESKYGLTSANVIIVPVIVGGFGTYKNVSSSLREHFKPYGLNWEAVMRACASRALVGTSRSVAHILQNREYEYERDEAW